MNNEEWVQISVPKERVREFYRLITETSPVAVDRDGTEVKPQEPAFAASHWADPETVRRAYRESQPELRRAFDLLAARPERWVTGEEVYAATGLSARRWPQQLSSLARRWRGRYKSPGEWPLRGEKVYENGKVSWHYLMPKEYADIIGSMQETDRGA